MAVASMGTKLKVGASGYVAELTDIGGLDISADTIETTSLDSNGWRSFIGGLKDAGEVSLSGHFNPDDTDGQKALFDALVAGTVLSLKIEFPTALGAEWSFSGVVTKFTTSSALEDSVTFEATIKVSGQPTLTLT
jgi:predicted secreted protein